MRFVGEFWRRSRMSCQPKKWRIWTLYLSGLLVFVCSTVVVAAQQLECHRLQVRATIDMQKGRELEFERQLLSEHCCLKHNVIDELACGRATLLDAASLCLQIDQNWPRVIASLRHKYCGNSDLEKEARCLVFIVCCRPMNPDARVLLVDRLGAEFRVLFPTASDLMISGQS